MPKFLDYNRQDGTWTQTEDHGDKLVIARTQDVEPILERMKAERSSGLNDNLKARFVKYATIPNVVWVELRKKGIDIMNPNQTKEVIREIEQNYPNLKSVNWKHG